MLCSKVRILRAQEQIPKKNRFFLRPSNTKAKIAMMGRHAERAWDIAKWQLQQEAKQRDPQ